MREKNSPQKLGQQNESGESQGDINHCQSNYNKLCQVRVKTYAGQVLGISVDG